MRQTKTWSVLSDVIGTGARTRFQRCGVERMSLASGIDRPSQGYAPAMRRPDLKFSIGTATECMAPDPDDEPIITDLEKKWERHEARLCVSRACAEIGAAQAKKPGRLSSVMQRKRDALAIACSKSAALTRPRSRPADRSSRSPCARPRRGRTWDPPCRSGRPGA